MYDTNSNDSLYGRNEEQTYTNKKCPKRRYHYPKNDKRCDPPPPVRQKNDRRSCRKCCEKCCGAASPSVFTAIVLWTRVVIDWILDKKSHIIVAAISFVLGTFFGDYCNCLYATGDPESDC